MRYEAERRVVRPEVAQFGIERNGLLQGLVADGVASFNGEASDSGGLEKDDGIIAGKLSVAAGVVGRKVGVFRIGPVGSPINGAAITQQDAVRIERAIFVFEMTLHMVNSTLGMALGRWLGGAGEPALKEDGGGFRHNDDGVTNLAAEQICRGGLATARATGKGDAVRLRMMSGAVTLH